MSGLAGISIPRDKMEPDVLVKLNGFSGSTTLRKRGRLKIPNSLGEVFELDLVGPYRDKEALVQEYWRFHPRYSFVKTVALSAKLLDLGAGSGGMIGWKSWGLPDRVDVKMFAVDQRKGAEFDRFVDYDLLDLSVDETKYPDGMFDAMICSHVINFMQNRERLAAEMTRILRPGGRLYVEWPTEKASLLISRKALEPFGIKCSTLNIADDVNQVALIGQNEARNLFETFGLLMTSCGDISNDFLYPELFRCGVAEDDSELTTYGLWLALRVANYMIFEKTGK